MLATASALGMASFRMALGLCVLHLRLLHMLLRLLHMLLWLLHVLLLLGLKMLLLDMLLLYRLLRMLLSHMLLLLYVLRLLLLLVYRMLLLRRLRVLHVLLLLRVKVATIAAVPGIWTIIGCCRTVVRCRTIIRGRPSHRTCICLCAWVIARAVDLVHREVGRATMINSSELIPIFGCRLFMGKLFGGPLNVRLPHSYLFPGIRSCRDTTGTVEAGPVVRGTDHRSIYIGIVDHCPVHIHHGSIVTKMSSFPPASSKPGAPVTVSIVHSPIKSHMGTPIPTMPSIDPPIVSPITRGPKESFLGWKNPYAGYPIITVVPISPITGHP
jgi:hypothetical protein